MREIPLTRGKVALVDDADYVYLTQWNWFAYQAKNTRWYARRSLPGKTIHMHRQIFGENLLGRRDVDHKDRNGLNNQRHNLRPATRNQNNYNQGLGKRNTSGFKGVSWFRPARRWRATLTFNGKHMNVGYYRQKIDAAVAYDAAAQIYFGVFARLNFSYDPACYI